MTSLSTDRSATFCLCACALSGVFALVLALLLVLLLLLLRLCLCPVQRSRADKTDSALANSLLAESGGWSRLKALQSEVEKERRLGRADRPTDRQTDNRIVGHK